MRYSSTHKTETRQRIMTMASLRFRAEGVANVGIANLMADLGLTHGGFYAHFHSKDDLVAQSCRQALLDMNEIWQVQLEQAPSGAGLKRLAKDYLSAAHRDFPDSGCAAAALAGELARHDKATRQAFSEGLQALLHTLRQAQQCDTAAGARPALAPEACLALMVGALLLSRAISDETLSDRLLKSAAAALALQARA
ncbi:TetR/AcrR family transcriptional regulator [Chromobacterium haemolyticum]|uniref:TetR/AcrR family transcriptional regulator n=1 Tax=Chromobacterium haemolyticum TaxID=394935 RepID=UPI0009DAF24F|nr:TetR/AcrR family transcriptional regulator [Chromobacterium haemolyticum]OQS36189.1 TetR family transcriptional regulator [Chromobacterium haemolyticum]